MRRRLPAEAPPEFQTRVLPGPAELAEAAAREIADAASEAVADRGRFCIALSGGSTPGALHERLARSPFREELPWKRTLFFWGDERCVPPRSARSNYRMARETLLAPLRIPPAQVFRMRGEIEPGRAAHLYRDVLAKQFAAGRPVLDLILLGLGSDGHTASLFPETRALAENRRAAVANWVPKLQEWRLTLTYPAINAARRVLFLVSGSEKAQVVARILKKERGYRRLPAARVRALSVLWMLDEEAGALL
ncbi:MAG: 6-phosphogluconolactonase [Thermoanaerobaculia bacterium]